jgi:hypothetical protein
MAHVMLHFNVCLGPPQQPAVPLRERHMQLRASLPAGATTNVVVLSPLEADVAAA